MAKNPMQKKAQNSFLLGMLITLVITGLIIGFLVVQLTKITKEQKEKRVTFLKIDFQRCRRDMRQSRKKTKRE